MQDYVGEAISRINSQARQQGSSPVNLLTRSPQLVATTLAALLKSQKAQQDAMANQRISRASAAGDLPQVFIQIDSTSNVTAGASFNVTSEPVTNMRITDLFADPRDADDFLLDGLKVGRLDHLVGAGSLPVGIFSAGNQRPPIETPILPAGTNAQVTGSNRAGADRRLLAAFVGIDTSKTYDVTG